MGTPTYNNMVCQKATFPHAPSVFAAFSSGFPKVQAHIVEFVKAAFIGHPPAVGREDALAYTSTLA